jgi:hypothetical protein
VNARLAIPLGQQSATTQGEQGKEGNATEFEMVFGFHSDSSQQRTIDRALTRPATSTATATTTSTSHSLQQQAARAIQPR